MNHAARLERLEARAALSTRQPASVILVTAGGQSEEEVQNEIRRVCHSRGRVFDPASTLVILRAIKEVSPSGPVAATRPVVVTQIDGEWLN